MNVPYNNINKNLQLLKYGKTNAFFNKIEQRIPNMILKVCYDMTFIFEMLNTFMRRLIP
jgi:hypothetical protein